jgi:uncharacterized tellurite resistance protein B-like protein
MLPPQERAAVYSLLFAAAFSDSQLHQDELRTIFKSLGIQVESGKPISSELEADLFRRMPLDECLHYIRNSSGDLATIITILLIEVIAADRVVLPAEIKFLATVLPELRDGSIAVDGSLAIAQRLNSLVPLIAGSDSLETTQNLQSLIATYSESLNPCNQQPSIPASEVSTNMNPATGIPTPASSSNRQQPQIETIEVLDPDLAAIVAYAKRRRHQEHLKIQLRKFQ